MLRPIVFVGSVISQPVPMEQILLNSQSSFICGSSLESSRVRSYTMEDVFRSKRRGYLAVLDNADIVDDHRTPFPKRVPQDTTSHLISHKSRQTCNKSLLMLAPLLGDSVFMDRWSAGTDRVIFASTNGTFCVVL